MRHRWFKNSIGETVHEIDGQSRAFFVDVLRPDGTKFSVPEILAQYIASYNDGAHSDMISMPDLANIETRESANVPIDPLAQMKAQHASDMEGMRAQNAEILTLLRGGQAALAAPSVDAPSSPVFPLFDTQGNVLHGWSRDALGIVRDPQGAVHKGPRA